MRWKTYEAHHGTLQRFDLLIFLMSSALAHHLGIIGRRARFDLLFFCTAALSTYLLMLATYASLTKWSLDDPNLPTDPEARRTLEEFR